MRKVILVLIIFISCDFNLKSENINIARVGEKFFSEEDLIDRLPKNLNLKDSTDLVNELIENWALNQLLIKNAEINLSDSEKNKLKKISENYYNDLLVSAYKNKVAAFNSDTMVNENDIYEYYNKNFKNFLLYEDIIKGRYARLNKNNFNLSEIKRRFKRFNQSDLVFFDSISLQLLNYSLNDSTWVNKDLFFDKIPIINSDEIERIVKKMLYVVKEDSLDVYLVKIEEFKGTNEKAPLDFINSRIKELIKKKKKVDFIKKFDNEILGNAKQENKFEIFN
ncbi:MAG: hypothetical protein ISQ41_01510 [Flavobacteriaceae bacterium]|nr:hypothetical protein [Flavobacteriaceae bacterium]MBL6684131.1 hypothetical protein [Flavobacteriaceae bacterium]PDH51701.1 MAG: hypothetical protein CND00_03120 [Cryomorphaceae bacterium MED-G14]